LALSAQKVSTFCKGLKLAGAGACGLVSPTNQPALLVNRFGKGRAILINGDVFQAYDTARANCLESPADLAIKEALEALLVDELARAEVRPLLKVTENADSGKSVPLLAKYTMVDGNIRYYGSVRYNDTLYAAIESRRVVAENKRAVFQFPGEAHLYDVLSKQYLGKVSRAQADLDVVGHSLFAAMPYRIDSIRIVAEKQGYARGDKVKLTLSVQCDPGDRAKHFARVRVLDPAGREYAPYARNVTLPSGAGEYLLQLALDEAPGRWTVEAEEVVSGAKSNAAFAVLEP
jgi:hypothetical protein